MRTLRSLVVLVPLLVSSGRVATASPSELGGVNEPVSASMGLPLEVVPIAVQTQTQTQTQRMASGRGARASASSAADGQHSVYWTVAEDESVDALASRWGLMRRDLVRLNPELRGRERVGAGARLRVFEPDPQAPTQSVGAPNNGRLRHGLPMPEGDHWVLRDRRTRAFGARNAIHAMVAAFERYGAAFDDAPPVSVGEISYRRGGRALPHRSHRTGRDVDLGYILTASASCGPGKHWARAGAENFDAEKNWALIRALVETGEVQQIFISNRLQRLLRPVAREQLSDEEYARYFRVPGRDSDEPPLLKHWDGHRDHMHVRFRCEPGNHRCRSRSSRGTISRSA